MEEEQEEEEVEESLSAAQRRAKVAETKLSTMEVRLAVEKKKTRALEAEVKKIKGKCSTRLAAASTAISDLLRDLDLPATTSGRAAAGSKRAAAVPAASAGDIGSVNPKRPKKVGASSPPPVPSGGSSPGPDDREADPTREEALAYWEQQMEPFAGSPIRRWKGTGPWDGQVFEAPLDFMFNPADLPSIWPLSNRRSDAGEFQVEAILSLGTAEGKKGTKMAPYAT